MSEPRDMRIAEREAEIARLRGLPSGECPWDLKDDPRADVGRDVPCPVCGMLGWPDAEDLCVGGPRTTPDPVA